MSPNILKTSSICLHSFWVCSYDNFWSLFFADLFNRKKPLIKEWLIWKGFLFAGESLRTLQNEWNPTRSLQNHANLGSLRAVKLWMGWTRRRCRSVWTGETLYKLNKAQMKKYQKAISWGKLQIFLGNQHSWVPLWSAVHECLQHGEQTGRIRYLQTPAGLLTNWDHVNVVN